MTEHVVVPPTEAPQELRKRADRIHIVRMILDLQQQCGWSDEITFALAACYLGDALEHTSKLYIDSIAKQIVEPFETIKDGEVVRYAFLGNAARDMYDALKRFYDEGYDRQICERVIAKAEGRIK